MEERRNYLQGKTLIEAHSRIQGVQAREAS